MKHLNLLFFLVFSCASQQNSTEIYSIQTNVSPCPEDGDCTFEVLTNQSFSIEKDGIGALYPKIVDGNTIILKFEYKRNDIPNTADGQFRELVYLELNPEHLEINLKDGELNNVKALFARLCFCRGQTGYYTLNQGQIAIKKLSENQYHLKMRFKIDEVPQAISEIDEVFSIK